MQKYQTNKKPPANLLNFRTIGLETEYSIFGTEDGWDASESDTMTDLLLGVREGADDHDFLPNGGCLYNDCAHPEYASPECCTPDEAALYHHAGDRLLCGLQRRYLEAGGDACELYRDNVDWEGTMYGCHENYLVLRSVPSEVLQRNLLPFMVSSPILFGVGFVQENGNYGLSARAAQLDCVISQGSATEGSRAIINMRDESHLPEDLNRLFRRFHVTCRDANVSQFATFLKIASTSIVLAMIEGGWAFEQLIPENALQAMKAVGCGNVEGIKLAKGMINAYDMQRRILAQACRFVGKLANNQDIPGWCNEALKLWGTALDDLSVDDLESNRPASCWIDWWVKWKLLEMYRQQNGGADRADLFAVSLLYHNLDPEVSLAEGAVMDGALATRYSPDELSYAAANPSSHVRARERALLFSQHCVGAKEVSELDWATATVNGKTRDLSFRLAPVR